MRLPGTICAGEGGYSLETAAEGDVRWKSPCGLPIPMAPRSPPSHPGALQEQNATRGLEIDENTCWSGLGERIDFSMAVEAVWEIVEG